MIEVVRALTFTERYLQEVVWSGGSGQCVVENAVRVELPDGEPIERKVELDSGLRFVVIAGPLGVNVLSDGRSLVQGTLDTFDRWAMHHRIFPPRFTTVIAPGWCGELAITPRLILRSRL